MVKTWANEDRNTSASQRQDEFSARRLQERRALQSRRLDAAHLTPPTVVDDVSDAESSKVVLQKDFLNVVGSSAGTEVEVTMDADGGLRFYGSSGGGSGISDGDKGDITVSGTGAVWTIDNATITYAKIQNVSATDKVLGRSTAGAGVVEEIACTAAGRALIDDADASAQRTTLGLGTLATQSGTFSGTSSGTNTGDQTITLTGDVTGSGTGSFAATIANDAVTYAKMQNVSATDKMLGRSTAGAGDVEEIACTATGRGIIASTTVGNALKYLGGGIGATGSGGIVLETSPILVAPALGTPVSVTLTNATGLPTAGLVNDAVTYAKIQNVSATDKVLGRSTAGAGDVEEIDCTATGRSIIASASTQAAIDAITDAGGGEVAGAVWTSDGTNGSWSASAAPVDQSEVLIRDRDDFLLGTVGWSVSTSGSGATCSAATDHVNSTENAVGEVSMGTGTTSTGRGGLYGAPGGILFGSSGAWTLNMRATCSPYAAGETFVFWIGFGDGVAGSGQPVDGAYFVHRYDTDGDHWVCVTRSNSTETKTVTSSAPAYATLDLFRIEVNEAGTSVSFYINGVLEAIHTTNIPTGSGRQFGLGAKIEKTASTTGKFGYVDYIEWAMTRSTAR